jgi:hypothetical protein
VPYIAYQFKGVRELVSDSTRLIFCDLNNTSTFVSSLKIFQLNFI